MHAAMRWGSRRRCVVLAAMERPRWRKSWRMTPTLSTPTSMVSCGWNLGEKPSDLMAKIGGLVSRLTGEPAIIASMNDAPTVLAEALGERRILLIIDDAWREQDLRPFLQGGHNTTRLITTRRGDILPREVVRQPVDAMQASEALALLSWGLPQDQATGQGKALGALG